MTKSFKPVSCENCQCKNKGIFCDLDHNELAIVGQNKIMNSYKKGQTVFFQGNPTFGLYCINSGKIKLSKIGPDGKESIIRIAGPGDVLGHRSLFSNEKFTATATVLEDSAICFLDKKFIFKAIQQDPSISLHLIEKLSRDMGKAEDRAASMAQKNVRERLAELLLMLKNSYGIKEDNRWKLEIKLTREEMASMIGTANETIIRFISEFKEEGLLEQEGKTIFILDEDGLVEIANLAY